MYYLQMNVPAVFQLAGHPLRWRVLSELAASDRRVRELIDVFDESQPLISYHLRELRQAGLVTARRSSFDGRDRYYSLDLNHYRQLLVDAGVALHPALQLSAPTNASWPRLRRRRRVLFLCTGNSARSQLAESLLRELSGGSVESFSAGSKPKPLHPNAVAVMRDRGIDIARHQSKHLDAFARQRFDCVITLCDRVREVCPEFPSEPQTIHWSIPDPAAEPGSDSDTYPAFERVSAELETRICFLLHRLATLNVKEVSRA
jgi:ArsR family transcriptional regulator, arsenate/arsenite/antimonite-responsive transcriptional repressor / arsenate reductase (thioredoxin)